MTQDINKATSTTEKKPNFSEQQQKSNREKREKNVLPSKVVVRRLPPSMTLDVFLEQVAPAPEFDYIYFVRGDMSLGQHAFSRVYINFVHQEDIYLFKEKFDDYVFVDQKGTEYPAVVEFALFQKIPKKKVKKDTKCGTIEQDPEYIKFLESLQNPEEVNLPSAEFYLEEIENRERELRANNGVPQASTPLIDYLKQKKIEKQRIREEKREERKRRELEKKRLKEEERRRRKAEKDKEREKAKEKEGKDKSADDKAAKEPSVKLLKNPEREKVKEIGEKSGRSKDSHGSDGPAVREKLGKENEEKVSRGASSGHKDWESERRRQEEKQKSRDKLRDRREREKFKKDRDEHGKSGYNKNVAERPSTSEGGGSSYTGVPEERSRTGASQSRSSEWHRDRPTQKSSTLPSHSSSTSGRTTSYRGGGGGGGGGGKSYERFREGLARERKEAKSSTDSVKNKRPVPTSDGNSRDQKSLPVDSQQESDQKVRAKEERVEEQDWKVEDASANNDEEGEDGSDIEADGAQENKSDRGKSSSKARGDRRIRNKDRPSMVLYRPGMRRLSLQRNSPQKESPSSSSSPSPTAQLREKTAQSDMPTAQQPSGETSPQEEPEVDLIVQGFVDPEDEEAEKQTAPTDSQFSQ